ncbi:MAG TPA: HAD-IIIC family phosphatase [Pseudonocardiaceae bacterium]|nr:HAD-IIIC family phosphatase [Pseudonocardiaceae bacterium]
MMAASDVLLSVKRAVRAGEPLTRPKLLALAESADPMTFRQAGRALAGVDAAVWGLRPVKVGLLTTATAGPLAHILRAALVSGGMAPTFTSGDYGAFDLLLSAADGPPFIGQDVLLCLLDDAYFLPRDWAGSDVAGLVAFVDERVAAFGRMVASAAERSGTTILLHTVPLSSVVRDTFISWRDRAALSGCWARLNAALLGLAEIQGIVAVDLVGDLAETSVSARDDRLKQYADIPYTDGALMVLAKQVRRFAQAKAGLSRKVLALDLDNTLWGGVLGEVGAAGVTLGGLYPGNSYQQLQRTALRLRDQGVILALASKNDADQVESALRDHPEVLLRPDVFSASAVNWQPKAGNLKHMADQLDLASGSFVFMDDSPFERGHVAEEAPEVTVVSADGDPAYLVRSLTSGGWFDTLELTDTDRKRPELYRTRMERGEFAGTFGSSVEYLAALDITVTVTKAGEFDIPRIAQLAARTNQYNLTGIRFGQPETAKMAADPAHLVISWAVADRFGDEGVVGAAWIDRAGETWSVLNLVMSCRVLGRGVESSVLGWLANQARAAGARVLAGRFVPSGRNSVAAEMWTSAGFVRTADATEATEAEQTYTLALDNTADLVPSWIKLVER